MENPSDKFVYHGSHELFDLAHPKPNKRYRTRNTGERYLVFEGISFHATPYKWIALAYTNKFVREEINGKQYAFTMGVDLYLHNMEVDIFGINSLEESLEKLYGEGGYVYWFDKSKFIHTEGLGNLELVSQTSIEPLKTERIDNPVEEMKKLGVTFKFIDLTLPDNETERELFTR